MKHLDTKHIVTTEIVSFLTQFEEAVNEGWRVSSSNEGYPLLTRLTLSCMLTKTPEEVKESLHTKVELEIKGYVTEAYTLLLDVQAAILQGYSIVADGVYYDGLQIGVKLKRVERTIVQNLGYDEREIVIPIVQYYSQPEIKSWSYEKLRAFAQLPELDCFVRDKAQCQKAVWQKLREICPRVEKDDNTEDSTSSAK